MIELRAAGGPERRLTPGELVAAGNPLAEWFLENDDDSIHKWHHYFDVYHRTFDHRRGRPVRVLEIGVARGGSLRMWQSYFAEGSLIVGIDVHESCRVAADPDRNIEVRLVDQADPAALLAVAEELGPFDIVIDDGGHRASQQLTSFATLYVDHVTPDGCYLVEDTHTSYWPEYQDRGPDETFMAFASSAVHQLNAAHFDHRRDDYGLELDDRLRALDIPVFTATTRSIQFYDSIVVFERGDKALPAVEQR